MQQRIRKITAAIGLTAFLLSAGAHAATVAKVKDKRVIINLDGMSLNVDEKVFLTKGGKKLAIVTIKQVKNGRALGEVDKGAAAEGMMVMQKNGNTGGNGGSASNDDSSSSPRRMRRKKGFQFGGFVGIAMDSQSVTLANQGATLSQAVPMSGMGFDLNLIGDMNLSNAFALRIGVGYEGFSVTGNSSLNLCAKNTSGTCTTSISFLALEGWVHLNVIGDVSPIWLGAGGEFLIPISSSSNALDPSSISTNFAVGGGLGVNWRLGGTIIPIQVDYMILPSSGQVTTNTLRIRAGLMF